MEKYDLVKTKTDFCYELLSEEYVYGNLSKYRKEIRDIIYLGFMGGVHSKNDFLELL